MESRLTDPYHGLVLRPVAVVVRGACAVHCVQDCFRAVTYLVLINLPISADSISNKFVELPLIIVKDVLIEVSIAHSLIHGTSGVKSIYYPGSCSSLLISLCRNVSFCFCLWFSKQQR